MNPGVEIEETSDCCGDAKNSNLLAGILCRRSPLSKKGEQYYFCRMNFDKFSAEQIRQKYLLKRTNAIQLDKFERRLNRALVLRNRIVEANLRLVVSVAKRFSASERRVEDLVGDVFVPLIRAVELFDVSRGYRFSTYATRTIQHAIVRSRARWARCHEREIVSNRFDFESIVDSRANVLQTQRAAAERKTIVAKLLRTLSEREQRFLSERFGLIGYEPEQTFKQIGKRVGLSKERVRVGTQRAIEKLRQERCFQMFDRV